MFKRCTKCGVEKPLTEFSPAARYRYGVNSRCRACTASYALARYQADRDRLMARQRDYRKADAERERARDRAYKTRVGYSIPKYSHERYEAIKARSKDRLLARAAVGYAVRVGRMPAAKTLSCVDCADSARYYDHFLGYAKANRLDVEPVCVRCSVRRSGERGEIRVVSPIARKACLRIDVVEV